MLKLNYTKFFDVILGVKLKYSVIIPVYNVEKYIDRCLKSIISQNYDDLEL
ncbi:MAG: glycosyltransferase [Streptococcus sp.]